MPSSVKAPIPTSIASVELYAFLRTVVMNLLRLAGYRLIRQGFLELPCDIKGLLALGEVATGRSTY